MFCHEGQYDDARSKALDAMRSAETIGCCVKSSPRPIRRELERKPLFRFRRQRMERLAKCQTRCKKAGHKVGNGLSAR